MIPAKSKKSWYREITALSIMMNRPQCTHIWLIARAYLQKMSSWILQEDELMILAYVRMKFGALMKQFLYRKDFICRGLFLPVMRLGLIVLDIQPPIRVMSFQDIINFEKFWLFTTPL